MGLAKRFQLGPEGYLDIKIEDGKAVISGQYKGEDDVLIELKVTAGPKAALDKVKQMIPGKWDDLIIDGIEEALGLNEKAA